MAHGPRYEVRVEAAWRDRLASRYTLDVELKTAPPQAPWKAFAAVARMLREPPVCGTSRLVHAILGKFRKATSPSGCRLRPRRTCIRMMTQMKHHSGPLPARTQVAARVAASPASEKGLHVGYAHTIVAIGVRPDDAPERPVEDSS